MRTDNFKKKAVFVCTFRADRGKNSQNAHIKSMKKPFSYVQMGQDFEKSFEKALVVHCGVQLEVVLGIVRGLEGKCQRIFIAVL